jgi:hypothetical protein
MTSKRNRIRRGLAGISLGLAVSGGGFVLTGLPAANASSGGGLYNCSTVPNPVTHVQARTLEDQGLTCTKIVVFKQ